MKKIQLSSDTLKSLIELHKQHNILLEGNILKAIDLDTAPPEKLAYLKEALKRDTEQKRRQLSITEQVRRQNKELETVNEKLEKALKEKNQALELVEQKISESIRDKYEADYARLNAERDLEIELKKSKNQSRGRATIIIIILMFFIVALYASLVYYLQTETAFQAFSTMCTTIVGAIVGYLGFYFKTRDDDNNKSNLNESKKLMV